MTDIPALHDIDETSRLTHRSKSWLYHAAAARKIPFTQHCPGGRLFWTDEQIAAIIRAGAVEPKPATPAKPSTQAKPKPTRAKPAPAADANVIRMPRARPEARRKRRQSA